MNTNKRKPETFEELEGEEAKRYIDAVDYKENSDYGIFAEEVKQIEDIEGKVVLEIGSGPGNLCFEFEKRKVKKITGLDGSNTMINYAKNILKNKPVLKNTINFIQGIVYDIPFENDSFDITICQNSFHHFIKPEKALDEMIRVTKKGGIIFIGDYKRDSDKELVKLRLNATKSEIKEDLQNTINASFTKQEFINMLRKLHHNINFKVEDAKNPLKHIKETHEIIKMDPIPHFKDYELSLRATIRKGE